MFINSMHLFVIIFNWNTISKHILLFLFCENSFLFIFTKRLFFNRSKKKKKTVFQRIEGGNIFQTQDQYKFLLNCFLYLDKLLDAKNQFHNVTSWDKSQAGVLIYYHNAFLNNHIRFLLQLVFLHTIQIFLLNIFFTKRKESKVTPLYKQFTIWEIPKIAACVTNL